MKARGHQWTEWMWVVRVAGGLGIAYASFNVAREAITASAHALEGRSVGGWALLDVVLSFAIVILTAAAIAARS